MAIPELNKFKAELEKNLIVIGICDERRMYNLLEIQGIPHCILINPDGIIRW